MTEEEKDLLLDEATHAIRNLFEDANIVLSTDDLYQINDFLTELLERKES